MPEVEIEGPSISESISALRAAIRAVCDLFQDRNNHWRLKELGTPHWIEFRNLRIAAGACGVEGLIEAVETARKVIGGPTDLAGSLVSGGVRTLHVMYEAAETVEAARLVCGSMSGVGG